MSIRQVSYGLLGTVMLFCVTYGCTNDNYKNKAKEQAAQYLNGYNLLKAERYVHMQHSTDQISAKEAAYWNSLLIDAKSKKAYFKGQQLVKDSLNGKYYRKEKFKPKLDTIINHNLIANLCKEVSKYATAKDFIKYRNNAPSKDNHENEFLYETHYWNLITLAGKQNEAYQKGMIDERTKINSK